MTTHFARETRGLLASLALLVLPSTVACGVSHEDDEASSHDALTASGVERLEVSIALRNPDEFSASGGDRCLDHDTYTIDLRAKTMKGEGCDAAAIPKHFVVDRALTDAEVATVRAAFVTMTSAAELAECPSEPSNFEWKVAATGADGEVVYNGGACIGTAGPNLLATDRMRAFGVAVRKLALTRTDDSVVTFTRDFGPPNLREIRLWKNPNGTYDVTNRWVERSCGRNEAHEWVCSVDWDHQDFLGMRCSFGEEQVECTKDDRADLPPPIDPQTTTVAEAERLETALLMDIKRGRYQLNVITIRKSDSGLWDATRHSIRLSSAVPIDAYNPNSWVDQTSPLVGGLTRY